MTSTVISLPLSSVEKYVLVAGLFVAKFLTAIVILARVTAQISTTDRSNVLGVQIARWLFSAEPQIKGNCAKGKSWGILPWWTPSNPPMLLFEASIRDTSFNFHLNCTVSWSKQSRMGIPMSFHGFRMAKLFACTKKRSLPKGSCLCSSLLQSIRHFNEAYKCGALSTSTPTVHTGTHIFTLSLFVECKICVTPWVGWSKQEAIPKHLWEVSSFHGSYT